MLFSKVVVDKNGKKVYAPIGGHYAFYLSEFEELKQYKTETDVWDLITRS